MEREELEAAVAARREVGSELEPQLIEGFLERVGKQIDARVDERIVAVNVAYALSRRR